MQAGRRSWVTVNEPFGTLLHLALALDIFEFMAIRGLSPYTPFTCKEFFNFF